MASARDSLGPEELERLRTGLKIMALRALGDPEAAEEVAQETLARALAALREGRTIKSGDLGAFVRGIARHVIVDQLRERGRTTPLETAASASQSSSPNPLNELITAEERLRVRNALSELSDRDRQILQLSFFDGLTPAEIAKQLGDPSERIRKRKSRALARLRRAFLDRTATVTNAPSDRPFSR